MMNFSQLNDSLTQACRTGDIEQISSLLQQGADINHSPFYPLEIAAQHGHLNVVKFLIEEGANYSCETFDSAIENGHLAIIKYVVLNLLPLERPNFSSEVDSEHDEITSQCELLASAIRHHQLPIVQFLLTEYDWLNNLPSITYRCLNFAASHQANPIISYLLENCSKEEDFEQLIYIATSESHTELMTLLLHHSQVLISQNQKIEMFYRALVEENLDLMDLLIKNNLDLNQAMDQSYYNLYQGSIKSIQWLEKHGQDVKKPYGKSKSYPLVDVAKGQNQESLRYMLTHSMTTSVKNQALIASISKYNLSTIMTEILLQSGADVHYQDGLVIEKLIEVEKYDLAIQTMDRNPTLNLDARIENIYRMAFIDHQLDVVKYFYQLGYSLDQANYFLPTLLNNNIDAATFLIQKNINFKQNNHEAFHMLITETEQENTEEQHMTTIQWLIEQYHNPNECLHLLLEKEATVLDSKKQFPDNDYLTSIWELQLGMIEKTKKLLQYYFLQEHLSLNNSVPKSKL